MATAEKKYTTLSISMETKKELADICGKLQTYDDLIKELVKERKRRAD